MHKDRWISQQPTGYCPTSDLKTGHLVVSDRRPFRIDRATAVSQSDWPDNFVEAWRGEGMPDPDTWRRRPMKLSGLWEGPDADSRLHHAVVPANQMWDRLPEHYSVCHKCLELPPCRHVHTEGVMQAASERMAQDMSIIPGVCHGCREPISKRQKSFTFPGPNLIRPDLGDDTAIFHTRSKCYWELTSYDKRWANEEPHRTRLFFCDGTMTIHHDQTVECDNDQCMAKGQHRDLVDHMCRVWHHPEGEAARGTSPCWCVSAA